MAMTKIKRSSPSRSSSGYSYDASFSISKRDNLGTIRIGKAGVEKIKRNGGKLLMNDQVDVYMDDESGDVAVVRCVGGEFTVRKASDKNQAIRISSTDLTKRIKKQTFYMIEKNADYDVFLVPIKSTDKNLELGI